MNAMLSPEFNVAITPVLETNRANPVCPVLASSKNQLEGKKKTKHRHPKRSSSFYGSKNEDAALRQAAEGGYLISPSRTFLLKRCSTTNHETHSLKEIYYIHLAFTHIRTLGRIQSCRHLKVCILHNNYLTRFNALANCEGLVRLDLHSNQISKLPDEGFWMHLANLQILNLHDNGIGDLDSIQSLAACPKLVALTLYDTPASLRHNYRHHTVNSLWSLKALDHHVISDEEIIEDASFVGRFRALHASLAVDLCPKENMPVEERTLDLELYIVRGIIQRINRLLAHGSPVIVIQRWIRGHFARKKRGVRYGSIIKKMQKLSRMGEQSLSGEGYEIDFDSYMQNRRPGSKATSRQQSGKTDSVAVQKQILSDIALPTTLHINLAKFGKVATERLQNTPDYSEIVEITGENKDSTEQKKGKEHCSPSQQNRRGQRKPKRKDPLTVQQMLGPKPSLVQPPSPIKTLFGCQQGTLNIDLGLRLEDFLANGEQPQHSWRIHTARFKIGGDEPPTMKIDPMQDILLMTQTAAHDIKDAEELWHEQQEDMPKPSRTKFKPEPKYKDQVSLATLLAVSKAYRDREKSDQLAAKAEKVLKIQREKIQTRHIVNSFKEEHRNFALNKRQEDRIRITRALQQQELNRNAYVEYAQERREKNIHRHEIRHKDLVFATGFSNQHTSVSTALVRHDKQASVDDTQMQKREKVKEMQLQLSEQADLVRRYMEHRQMMQHLTNGQEKARLTARTQKEANKRMLLSKERVATAKAQKAAAKALRNDRKSTTAENQETTPRASPTFDRLHLTTPMPGDDGVLDITPGSNNDGSFTLIFRKPKTARVLELPPLNPTIQPQNGSPRHQTFSLAT